MCMCENANAIKYLQFSDFSRKGIPNLTSGESEFRTFSEKSDLSLALHLVYWGWKHIYNCQILEITLRQPVDIFTFIMKSLTVPSSNFANASVWVTAVIWFKLNLKQNSSNSRAYQRTFWNFWVSFTLKF